MTAPDNSTGIALQYVREELAVLRTAVHDELAGVRADLSGLAGELRGHSAQVAPRMAVLEHRTAELEKDLVMLRAEGVEDKRLRWTVAGAVLVAVLAWVPPLLQWIGGG
jgi:hypothetical protein